MIVDTSALIAILYAEQDAELYARALAAAEHRLISAANYLEAGIVTDRQMGAAAGRQFDALLTRAQISVEPVTKEHAVIARQAYLDFGKGIHSAGLNFGNGFPMLWQNLPVCHCYIKERLSQRPISFQRCKEQMVYFS